MPSFKLPSVGAYAPPSSSAEREPPSSPDRESTASSTNSRGGVSVRTLASGAFQLLRRALAARVASSGALVDEQEQRQLRLLSHYSFPPGKGQ